MAEHPTRADRSVWQVRERLDESWRQLETALEGAIAADDPKQCLAALDSLRQYYALAHRMLHDDARIAAVREFEDIVLAALEEAAPDVRRRVLDVLRDRRDSLSVHRPV